MPEEHQDICSRKKVINMEKSETLGDYTKIVIETDEKNPTAIATITNDGVDVADGYRVRLTPKYD